MRFKLILLLLLVCGSVYSQTNYSYTDPCTGNTKTVQFNGNSIPFTYYGQIKSFTQDEIRNGDFDRWAQSISQTFGNNNPCGSLVGIPSTVNISQGVALNLLSIINSLSSLSDMTEDGETDIINTNAIQNSKEKKKDKKTTDQNTQDNDGSGVSGSANSGENGNTTDNVNPNGGNGSTNTEVEKPNGNSKPTTEEGGGGKVNLVGNSLNSIQNTPTSKNGNRPTILATSDFVGFNFSNSDITYGGKVAGGYTSMRWDGLRASGVLCDYTSAINGPNMCGFYANMGKNRIDIVSTSLTLSFQTKFSIYGSLAIGQMWTLKKPKKMKIVYMIVGSYGKVYDNPFTGTAAIVGGMYDWKVSKRIDIKLLGLYVYAPYVKYHDDIVLKSPHVVLPIIGTNLGISKRFKFNVNVGGAYAVNVNTLNYTVMFGTRLLL